MRADQKRSLTPTTAAKEKRVRVKQDHDWDEDEIPFFLDQNDCFQNTVKSERGDTKDPTRGAEFKRIIQPQSRSVNTLVIQTTRELAAVGKRLVQAPRLLDDGILFDWVLDYSAKQESVDSLLAVAGIDTRALGPALQRVAPSGSEQGSSRDALPMIIDLLSDHESDVDDKTTIKLLGPEGGASHPIVIDKEEEDELELTVTSQHGDGLAELSPRPAESAADTNGDDRTEVSTSATSETNAAGPSQLRRLVDHDDEVEDIAAPCRDHHPERPRADQNRDDRQAEDKKRDSRSVNLYGSFNMLASSDSEKESEDEDERPSETPGSATTGSRDFAGSRPAKQLRPPFDHDNRVRISRTTFDDASAEPLIGGTRVPPRPSRHSRTIAGPSNSGRSSQKAARPARRSTLSRAVLEEQDSDGRDGDRSSLEDSDELRPQALSTWRRHVVAIPKAEFARARRLIAPIDQGIPYATITMRGDGSFIDRRRLTRISAFSLPLYEPDKSPVALVADACLVGDKTIVVGYAHGAHQASLILLGDQRQPRRVDLAHRAHSTVQENRNLGTSRPNPGISALAPCDGSRLQFLSGGEDRAVHLWTLRNTDGGYKASSCRLNVPQFQKVQALAYRSADETVFSCGGTSISEVKISARYAPDPIRVSDGRILQIHVHPQDPQVVILEVDHIQDQILVYDMRKGGFNRPPTLQFGHRDENAQGNTRFMKGSALNSFFARPHNDGKTGVVQVWDYRQARAVVACFKEEHPAPIVHTVLSGSDVLAYGGPSVTVWRTNNRN
ncbi:uncharacterized protein B0H18DRAFT_13198 [Fomitopsis serialis]|uniref:uncharacterized protein n=1 Tax=Fomitopsis serialis TaxID=139415 RepID=UPI0020085C5C|nr:uncharacterized protein B0H18DRAFT_13198 [Neoantrodia serialis]KAH9938391.1 hypothetical protein B0H18DRAFT_13198 [Neoantrodia serialis]